jgi:hypothetical protein
MQPSWQVRKVSDEGTSSPFMARLFMGMLSLRDQLYLIGPDGQQRQKMQDNFDSQFKPMYEAAQATRDAALRVRDLIASHISNIQSGRAIQFRGNQHDILETIDTPLGQAVDQVIDQSIIATKMGLQNMLRNPLNLEIGFFFQTNDQFTQGVDNLHLTGLNELAQYLEAVRSGWHAELQELRVKHEHNGWTLGSIDYLLVGPSKVIPILPKVLGMPVNLFGIKTANRVLLFIENMMVFALQRHCQQNRLPIFVVEIPKEDRDPKCVERFRLAPTGLDPSLPWVIAYHDDLDFI